MIRDRLKEVQTLLSLLGDVRPEDEATIIEAAKDTVDPTYRVIFEKLCQDIVTATSTHTPTTRGFTTGLTTEAMRVAVLLARQSSDGW